MFKSDFKFQPLSIFFTCARLISILFLISSPAFAQESGGGVGAGGGGSFSTDSRELPALLEEWKSDFKNSSDATITLNTKLSNNNKPLDLIGHFFNKEFYYTYWYNLAKDSKVLYERGALAWALKIQRDNRLNVTKAFLACPGEILAIPELCGILGFSKIPKLIGRQIQVIKSAGTELIFSGGFKSITEVATDVSGSSESESEAAKEMIKIEFIFKKNKNNEIVFIQKPTEIKGINYCVDYESNTFGKKKITPARFEYCKVGKLTLQPLLKKEQPPETTLIIEGDE